MCQLLQTAGYTVHRVQMARSSTPEVTRCCFIHFAPRHLNEWYSQSITIKQDFELRKKIFAWFKCEDFRRAPFRFISRPSVRPSAYISTAPTADFIKICRENPNEFDIGQQLRAICVKTSVRFIVAGENISHKTFFSNVCYQVVWLAESYKYYAKTSQCYVKFRLHIMLEISRCFFPPSDQNCVSIFHISSPLIT
jgi:hypothetical protein